MSDDPQQHPKRTITGSVYRALLSSDILVTEVHFALIGAALGVRTIGDPRALSASGLRLMAGIAPYVIWGAVMLLIALIQVVGMLTRSERLRIWGMFCQSCYWTSVTILIGAAGPISWGPLLFGIMALSAGWSYLRLAARHRLHTPL